MDAVDDLLDAAGRGTLVFSFHTQAPPMAFFCLLLFPVDLRSSVVMDVLIWTWLDEAGLRILRAKNKTLWANSS